MIGFTLKSTVVLLCALFIFCDSVYTLVGNGAFAKDVVIREKAFHLFPDRTPGDGNIVPC